MLCARCGQSLPDDARYCLACGRRLEPAQRSVKKRGNGQGTVFRLASGKYKAVVTLGYFLGPDGKVHRRTRSRVCDRKKDALAAIPELLSSPKQERRRTLTFSQLYDLWQPTHRAGPSSMACYRAAIRYFAPLYGLPVSEIDVDDLQECIDACPKGRRTRENMRTVVGLMYKYGIPRKLFPDNLNLASFLSVSGDGSAHRDSFTDAELDRLWAVSGSVPGADAVLCMIYTGFRPSEFLALTRSSFDPDRACLVGGAKTEAGRNRTVTISPRILPLIQSRAAAAPGPDAPLFPDEDGQPWTLKAFTDRAFYPCLDSVGIDNSVVSVAGGVKRHRLTPHSCRHTFATLMKRVPGSEKDKIELIGHASGEQLRYYQDVVLDDLRRITDAL